MADKKSLVTKLAEVQEAVERVAKRGRNDFHRYDYATEADIVAAVRTELARRRVMLIPSVADIAREPVGEKGSILTTLRMTFTWMDGESGESLAMPWAGAGTDKEDKGLYKAMTGAEKYFLLKTFLIPTGDDPEREDKKAAAADAPETVVDTRTGEVVPAVQRPPAPEGFHYIHSYQLHHGWHEVVVNGLKLSTKHVAGEVAADAFQRGIPVRIGYKAKPGSKGEGYLNTVELWKPPAPDADANVPMLAANEVF